jgi:glycosyltransferase involved in cell wall biosynthesis
MPRHVCFISSSAISDEPRVRRQGDALFAAGYAVTGVGGTGGRAGAPCWPIVEVEFGRLGGQARARAIAHQAYVPLGRRAALASYWSDHRRLDLLATAIRTGADVFVAREWRTLPIAVRAAAATQGRVALDSPELSAEEMEHSPIWRWFFRPMIVAIEQTYARDVPLVTVVGDEIGAVMRKRYDLEATTTVRNLPPFESVVPSPIDGCVEVLFHGGVVPLRGIEEVIDSTSNWPADWRLRIRGNGAEPYVATLRDRAERRHAEIVFEPAVSLSDVVSQAAESHVGVFALPGGSRQREFALPNKLFEYLMAGLAVCVSDLPEMARIVSDWDCGVTIARPFGPDQIAEGIHELNDRGVATLRQNALRAASTSLNWEREAERYVSAFMSTYGPP